MNEELLCAELARAIDADEPPGIAARNVARAVLALVLNREAPELVLLEAELQRLISAYQNDPQPSARRSYIAG